MAEKVFIRQNSTFETEILIYNSETRRYQPAGQLQDVTPYGMLLVSLGLCTSAVLYAYARKHKIGLHEVELNLQFKRTFKEDCDNCEGIEKYEDRIDLDIALEGDLEREERDKLFEISRLCPVHKILENGMKVQSRIVSKGSL
ncbi:MAG TPA: OsmC family protein [Thermodesulfovibrionales bacterium]|nr:OsmC family protein [Thermodesulfovibrionales bacterium]